ncbi:MAG: hypothetical protein M1823_005881 [Watsoniomyces obsoletus]|nr:MAG: hypothetical protein M1823_005881 [Watsoniomyces obsoletus]
MSRAAQVNGSAQSLRSMPGQIDTLQPPVKSIASRLRDGDLKKAEAKGTVEAVKHRGALGAALSDTPLSTAPSSPRLLDDSQANRRESASGSSTPRMRATTLDVPGLTRSKVSPDGRIASIDIGSKLVIVMVGLPARGKSYITKKMSRYLNWLQHDTMIFNVGERRRVAAGTPGRTGPETKENESKDHRRSFDSTSTVASTVAAARILINGEPTTMDAGFEALPPPAQDSARPMADVARPSTPPNGPVEPMDQSAEFFDPQNTKAAQLREQIALATLDELLDYILHDGGSIGILDATNSTVERRGMILKRVRERAGPELGVLFVESLCLDQELLESNMRLKLSGPDYKDQEPNAALADFKKRVAIYEKNYVALGEFEEANHVPYVQMIDVGRKIVAHEVRGFLAAQVVYYLVNFNLCPRQIWITRHGESLDNISGRIGGDSELSENGQRYARALKRFIEQERATWTMRQRDRAASARLPPRAGDGTPPYTTGAGDAAFEDKNFCVWTSMLQRSIQTAQAFDEDDAFDVKNWRLLNELNAGYMDGMTYEEIREKHPDDYERRRVDKLHYRYPGPGGEGYLDVVHRLRSVIVEVERMTDHVLLVCHRSVARVLLAYFLGLRRDAVADVDVPLGVLYMIQPKPYGVAFKAFRYNPETDWFHLEPNFDLHRTTSQGV